MIRNLLTLRGFVSAVLVVGLISYIVTQPVTAGDQAADLANTIIGWGKDCITAIATFVRSIAK
jgi:hypothetical protein